MIGHGGRCGRWRGEATPVSLASLAPVCTTRWEDKPAGDRARAALQGGGIAPIRADRRVPGGPAGRRALPRDVRRVDRAGEPSAGGGTARARGDAAGRAGGQPRRPPDHVRRAGRVVRRGRRRRAGRDARAAAARPVRRRQSAAAAAGRVDRAAGHPVRAAGARRPRGVPAASSGGGAAGTRARDRRPLPAGRRLGIHAMRARVRCAARRALRGQRGRRRARDARLRRRHAAQPRSPPARLLGGARRLFAQAIYRYVAGAVVAAFALAGLYRAWFVPGALGQGPFCLFQ